MRIIKFNDDTVDPYKWFNWIREDHLNWRMENPDHDFGRFQYRLREVWGMELAKTENGTWDSIVIHDEALFTAFRLRYG